MRTPFVLCALSVAAAAAVAHEGGLVVDPERLAWPVLQARLHVGTESFTPGFGGTAESALRPRSAALLGDYYVSKPYFGNTGGVRLTSGLLVGPRGAVFGPGQTSLPGAFAISTSTRAVGASLVEPGTDSTLAWPYLGVGYSGANLRGGWGFSADLGLAAQNPGVLRLSKALGSQSLDDTLRELRLTPVLQLGVSYRF